jgi:hypothetical protein
MILKRATLGDREHFLPKGPPIFARNWQYWCQKFGIALSNLLYSGFEFQTEILGLTRERSSPTRVHNAPCGKNDGNYSHPVSGAL